MKQVHWQLPFASLNGTQYRIDIYAEGECASPIQLVGGATPFTTDEDNSDDFFESVRSQTGVISIVNTSGELSIYDILPADNTDKPVRVVRVNDGAVVWQGFLNAEAYSQGYNDRPQQIDLNVNSILEAMDSVEVEQTDMTGIMMVRDALRFVLRKMNKLYGKTGSGSLYSRIYYPQESWRIMTMYIDTTCFFDLKQQDNENSTSYEVQGISCAELLKRICTFMGWTVREQASYLYFGEDRGGRGYYYESWAVFNQSSFLPPHTAVELTNAQMVDMEYRGTGHQITVAQGAKSVEVVARLKRYELKMDLPECPIGTEYREGVFDGIGNAREYPIDDFNNMVQLASVHAMAKHYFMGSGSNYNVMYLHYANMMSLRDGFYSETEMPQSDFFRQGGGNKEYNWYLYACFARPTNSDIKSALLIHGTPAWRFRNPEFVETYIEHEAFQPAYNNALFKFNSIVQFACSRGWIRLKMIEESVKLLGVNRTGTQYLVMSLRYGNMYWNGSQWVEGFSTFNANLNNDGTLVSNKTDSMHTTETDGIFMPISEMTRGDIEVCIYYEVNILGYDYYYQDYDDRFPAVVTELSVDYVREDDNMVSDRSENHYFKLLGLNFSDEVTVSSDLASNLNNMPASTIIMVDDNTFAKGVVYELPDGTRELRRPEKDLLGRLAEYHNRPRRRIELEVERPNTPLPLVRVTGYDGKTYLPLSESRDWKADTSTITCFEIPE